jgi:hypothetical protein
MMMVQIRLASSRRRRVIVLWPSLKATVMIGAHANRGNGDNGSMRRSARSYVSNSSYAKLGADPHDDDDDNDDDDYDYDNNNEGKAMKARYHTRVAKKLGRRRRRRRKLKMKVKVKVKMMKKRRLRLLLILAACFAACRKLRISRRSLLAKLKYVFRGLLYFVDAGHHPMLSMGLYLSIPTSFPRCTVPSPMR